MTDYWPGYAGGDYRGGAKMNVNERINGLTEAEAKAALFKYATIPQKRCEFCRYNNKCNYSITKNSDDCFLLIFENVLKEI